MWMSSLAPDSLASLTSSFVVAAGFAPARSYRRELSCLQCCCCSRSHRLLLFSHPCSSRFNTLGPAIPPRVCQCRSSAMTLPVLLRLQDELGPILGEFLKADARTWGALLGVLLGYLAVLVLLGAILPGRTIAGAVLADNSRLNYKCNGFASLVVILCGLCVGIKYGYCPATIVADYGGHMCITTLGLCFVMSVWLHIRGYLSKSKSASFKSHVTGNVLHDWWFGVQLNPDLFGLDLKFFWIRAGMMGWLLINLSVAAKQYIEQGSLSLSMALCQVFCTIYVLDYFWHEEYMTSTWDIIAEHFGFMLIFGDMVFIPFTFSIQAWWLLSHSVDLTPAAAVMNVLVFVIGFVVFRGANEQKHRFKQNSKCLIWGRPAQTIGGRLLISGFWGIARHCNYLGDILLAFSFSLPCGVSSPVPYFYPTYLFILLLWRERRDEARCSAKYKEIWQEYRKAVPWRIFPYIY